MAELVVSPKTADRRASAAAPPGSFVARPTFSPGGGAYTPSVTVTIACATAGATIRFTTDGSEPTEASTEYTAPILLEP